ncbi:MAG TPA: hypothetical protein PLZ93_10610 [Nocardioides sp.]|uniref:hypothetical protein n=1 Tax=uncultured Nocardioides sp. TaxID=198441 RepID=UPI000EDC5E34|nr:hypothetical protein [uncultured Nocardioides sp.]HCB03755.1 hypothetical protein [Nocardioides sp.]HRD63158.1 hypothetical protein [Nocardioides sp.]HRI96057.1 hypothetical protein [Nocardioides sp.]HRK45672.1 hypothetical protein [Nocardioides sp.]
MRTRPLAVGTAAAALLLTGLVTSPAHALPPTTRTITDPVDKTAAYDITQVTMRSAPKSNRPAVVIVKHGRPVKFGDALDVWFDLDGDKVPDLHLSGSSFSEFTVRRAKSFTKDGKDISNKDCARLAMAGKTSKIRLFPACVGSPLAFAVAVKSSAQGKPASADDWAPRAERFTKKVLAAPLS